MMMELWDAKFVREAFDDAQKLVTIANEWLSEPSAEYALGAGAPYTMADVLLTCALTRM